MLKLEEKILIPRRISKLVRSLKWIRCTGWLGSVRTSDVIVNSVTVSSFRKRSLGFIKYFYCSTEYLNICIPHWIVTRSNWFINYCLNPVSLNKINFKLIETEQEKIGTVNYIHTIFCLVNEWIFSGKIKSSLIMTCENAEVHK